ncbi:MAG: MFS transporter [bacterium]|jgi:MFS family permease|nr:MFS transporter [bacterium]
MHPGRSFPFDRHKFNWYHLNPFPALTVHHAFGMVAFGIVGTFFPIFVYELTGQNLPMMFLWFAIAYGMRLPLFYVGAKIFSKTGLRTSMMIGIIMWCTYYIGGFVLDANLTSAPNVILLLSFLALAIFHSLYWAPFHVDFATFTKKGHRGREVSIIHILRLIIGIIIPVIGAYFITTYSFSVVFLIASACGLLSAIPLSMLPNKKVEYEFTFKETFSKIFSKKFRHLLISSTSEGAQGVVAYVAWPVFLFMILQGQYLSVGIISSAIVIINLLLQWVIGKQVDKKTPNLFLKWGVRTYSLGWLTKAFVDSVAGVFVASTFHSFGAILLATPIETILYQQAADAGHYIDEFTVIREIALTIGRFVITLSLALAMIWLPLSTAFLLAAGVTLFMTFMGKVHSAKEFDLA